MYGFDTAGTLAEETNNPRKHAPPAIIRAIAAAAIIGGLVILLASMANKHILDKNVGLLGLPYVMKQAFGNTVGQPVPARLRDRDLRLLPGRADRDDPDAVLDGARQPAAGRLRGRARLGSSQGADRAGAGDGRPGAGADGDQRRQPERVPRDHLDRDHHVLPRLPRGHRRRCSCGACAATGRSPTTGRTSRSVAGGCRSTSPPWPTARSSRSTSPGRATRSTTPLGTPHWYWQWSPFLFIGGVVIIGTHLLLPGAGQEAAGRARGAPGRRAGARAPARDG